MFGISCRVWAVDFNSPFFYTTPTPIDYLNKKFIGLIMCKSCNLLKMLCDTFFPCCICLCMLTCNKCIQ